MLEEQGLVKDSLKISTESSKHDGRHRSAGRRMLQQVHNK